MELFLDYREHDFEGLPRAFEYYNGTDKKFSVFYQDKVYMVKCPAKAKNENGLNTSYSHSSFSEFISCHIINALEIPGVSAQNTLLGTHNGKIDVACEDFTTPERKLVSFDMIHNTNLSSEDSGRHPILQDVLETYALVPSIKENPVFLERFWDTFILDALLGNFDRHSGNWGFLNNPRTGEMVPAPIFDCGSALYPALSDEMIDQILSSPEEIDKRIYSFPQSAIKDRDSNEKINYVNFLTYTTNTDCHKALKKITDCFSMEVVESVLQRTPYLDEKRMVFYRTMIQERFQKILVPAYERTAEKSFVRKDFSFSERLEQAKQEANRRNEAKQQSRNFTHTIEK